MTTNGIVALASLASFVASIVVNGFLAGQRWGAMRSDLESVKRDVAEIKGMFTLKLRE